MKFTAKENIQLTEIYRRLGYFKAWGLTDKLLFLGFPSEINSLKTKGILKVSYTEHTRCLNWYSLTENGQELFKGYIPKNQPKISDAENSLIFDGKKTMNFNKINT